MFLSSPCFDLQNGLIREHNGSVAEPYPPTSDRGGVVISRLVGNGARN
jgi:hypothetical protein